MTVKTNQLFDKDKIQAFSDRRNEPKWVQDIRLNSIDLVDSTEYPKPDKTNINRWIFTPSSFEFPEKETVSSVKELPESVLSIVGEDEGERNLLVQQNSTAVYKELSEELEKKGVVFTDLQTAFIEHSDKIKPYLFGEAVKPGENKLTAEHAACMNGGAFIYVPRNVDVEIPLQAVFTIDTEETGLYNHVVLVAEENSSVTYVENYISQIEGEAKVNIIAEVYAANDAHVAFGAVDTLSSEITTYVLRRGYVEQNARIDWALGQMNDGNTISDNTTHLVGDHSWVDTKTVSVGREKQIQNFTSLIVHHGKHTEGHILKHGVMLDEASSIFNGVTKIEDGATKANGVQTERVLMLSERARGDANPILLIDEDDVTAGHAASVGQVDPMSMFYLMSRGISRQEAERLIIHGFLNPVVDQLPIESVKERLREEIERKVQR